MKKAIYILLGVALAALVSIPGNAVLRKGKKISPKKMVGKPIAPWTEGCLDIHFINTISGECYYIIFPDGTDMLVDAAGSSQETGPFGDPANGFSNEGVRSRWDPMKEKLDCGEFISEYIRKCKSWTGNDTLNYALVSHFHCDHIGNVYDEPSKKTDAYRRQSWATILENFPVGLNLDRAYPDYDFPFERMDTVVDGLGNYLAAVKWHTEHSGMQAGRFIPGVNDQIVLKRHPEKYPDFQVRNICANGELWTGRGTQTKQCFPSKEEINAKMTCPTSHIKKDDFCPNGNALSCMFKLSYGDFDFAGFGDASFTGAGTYAWKDIESPAAAVCGEVEVFKADHHGSTATNGTDTKRRKSGVFGNAMFSLNPQCWIICGYTDVHPRKETMENVIRNLPATDIYTLNSCPKIEAYEGYDTHVKGANGHIVFRVQPGGKKYNVFVLSDSDRKMTVKSVSGDYVCR